MSEVTEMWREQRERQQRERSERRQNFDASGQEALRTHAGVTKLVRNSDAHWTIFAHDRRIEYWPGAKRWHLQGTRKSKTGKVEELYDFIDNLAN